MKAIFLSLVISSICFGQIPNGTYRLEKIMCSTGKKLKLGGKFMQYQVDLKINDNLMNMTAIAKSAKWAPFKLKCTQKNEGKFSIRSNKTYEGYLQLSHVECNAKMWEGILKKHAFGVEEQGTFTYAISGKKLTIENPKTVTKYSCKKTGGYPIYHYNKL